MKYINKIVAFVAGAFTFAACNMEMNPVSEVSGLSVSTSVITLAAEADASAVVEVCGDEDWTVEIKDTACTWLTVTPAAGVAGESVKVTFKATASDAARDVYAKIVMGAKYKNILVKQVAPEGVEVPTSTCKEVLDGPNITYRVTGTVTRIEKFDYGNWYINDGTVDDPGVLVYGTCDKKGNIYDKNKKNSILDPKVNEDAWDLSVGDVVTIEGPKTIYGTTIELANVTILNIIKSLIEATPELIEAGKDGLDTAIVVKYKGEGLEVKSENNWINITSMNVTTDSTVVFVSVAANEGDKRDGVITIKSAIPGQESVKEIAVKQESGLSCYLLPYSETFLADQGAWTIEYPEGLNEPLTAVWFWAGENYGMKASANKDKVNYASVADFISPLIDLRSATVASLTYDQVYRYTSKPDADLTLWISTDNNVTWNQILIPTFSTGKDWNFVTTSLSLTPYVGNIVSLKFHYVSTATEAATWEIQKLTVAATEVEASNVAQIETMASATEAEFKANVTNLLVSYVNGGNAFLQDATGGVQLYLKDHGLVAGTSYTGEISGKVVLYNGFAELKGLDVTKATATTDVKVEPKELTIAALKASYLRYVNTLVKIKGVTLSATMNKDAKAAEISQEGETIATYLQDKNVTVEAGTGNLICIPTRKNDLFQVGVWEAAHFTDGSEDQGGGSQESVYKTTLTYTLGTSSYEEQGTVNGEEKVTTLKIGTSKVAGEFTVTVPAGTKKVTFYAVAWTGKATTIELYDGATLLLSQAIADNAGASGNAPYTITVADSDKYTLTHDFTAETTVKFTTKADANKRAIFFGIKAEK